MLALPGSPCYNRFRLLAPSFRFPRPRWPSGNVSTSELEGFKNPPAGVVRKFGEEVPPQVSSPDRGSKLRVPSQNILSVASKRDVNVTKLKPSNCPAI
ncbi:hypothetical protein AVEN_74592-1 [Araneus ventricosus]|uniref:Uncharacterized protein n=1 Tax=Araneus ventricosus TaxID=182803 RepID=A0A4Y2W7J8_ARAVE|nr:hypothetical protein AVEN_74592-1 [Araneus ventricosus]